MQASQVVTDMNKRVDNSALQAFVFGESKRRPYQ